jgi:spore maturation protein CgeB
MKRKILVNAPDFYGIDRAIADAFTALGHIVVLTNYRTNLSRQEALAKRAGKLFPGLAPLFNIIVKHYLKQDNQQLLRNIENEKPDLLFVIKGDHIFPGALNEIKKKYGIKVAAYIWDDPFYSYAGQFTDDYRKNNFADSMALYDHIFVYDPYYVEQIRERGIGHVSYLPLATDPDKYKPVSLTAEEKALYGYDVCFVGVPHPNRLALLDQITGCRLGVFGDGWDNVERPYYQGRAQGEKVLKLYSASKIILNIHDPEAAHGVNTRTFDIPACKAFELVDHKPEIDVLFEDGVDLASYEGLNDLNDKIQYYLRHPRAAQMIAASGYQKVLSGHTWKARMRAVEDLLRAKDLL